MSVPAKVARKLGQQSLDLISSCNEYTTVRGSCCNFHSATSIGLTPDP